MKCPHLKCPQRHDACEHFRKSNPIFACHKRPEEFWKVEVAENGEKEDE